MRHRDSGRSKRRVFAGALLGVLGAIVGPVEIAAAAEPGLVGLWNFEDGAGVVIADSSGNGNTGTELYPEEHTPRWGTGEFAGALGLSATTNNFVQVPASPSLNSITTAITVVATVYPRELWTPQWTKSGTSVLVQRQWRTERHPDQYYLGYDLQYGILTYKWHLGLADGGEVWIDGPAHGPARPKVGAWVQVAGTYDAATGVAEFYVDGVLAGSQTGVGPIRLDPESVGRPLAIGAELNRENVKDVVGEFNGYVDEVRLYDRALSGAEIAALAASSPRLQH